MFEVEIKSLLGGKKEASAFMTRVALLTTLSTFNTHSTQLNHYFTNCTKTNLETLVKSLQNHLEEDSFAELTPLVADLASFSLRTRETTTKGVTSVLFVIKASMGQDTPENGIARREFERTVSLSLADLDALLLAAGFQYQAKWSRERDEFTAEGINICLDKNAGYGYLVEFEKVVGSEEEIEPARQNIRGLMALLGVAELPQDRLERMFAHYNAHWQDYYGTDRVFVVD